MKKELKKQLWEKNITQLKKLLTEKQVGLVQAELNLAKTKDKNKVKNLRREIARLLTMIKEKEAENA